MAVGLPDGGARGGGVSPVSGFVREERGREMTREERVWAERESSGLGLL